MADEKYRRVEMMIAGDVGTWNLSPADRKALRHCLSLINSLATGLSEYTGEPIQDVIAHHGKMVDKLPSAANH